MTLRDTILKNTSKTRNLFSATPEHWGHAHSTAKLIQTHIRLGGIETNGIEQRPTTSIPRPYPQTIAESGYDFETKLHVLTDPHSIEKSFEEKDTEIATHLGLIGLSISPHSLGANETLYELQWKQSSMLRNYGALSLHHATPETDSRPTITSILRGETTYQ